MTDTQREIAYDYYKRNRRKISLDIENLEDSTKPNEKDMNNPISWKPENWLWFIEH